MFDRIFNTIKTYKNWFLEVFHVHDEIDWDALKSYTEFYIDKVNSFYFFSFAFEAIDFELRICTLKWLLDHGKTRSTLNNIKIKFYFYFLFVSFFYFVLFFFFFVVCKEPEMYALKTRCFVCEQVSVWLHNQNQLMLEYMEYAMFILLCELMTIERRL